MSAPPSDLALPRLSIEPIGFVHSPFSTRVEAPRQATVGRDVKGEVVLLAGRGFEDALCDLSEWGYVWLLTWLDRGDHYRPKVRPPRSAQKRGVFATRAPYRPNPIGLSAVKLLRVTGLRLEVQGLDLLDQTPVLDIKPYVPYADCLPDAGHGWLSEPAQDPQAAYEVRYTELASQQLAFLETHGVTLKPRIDAALALGPSPHAYRRIRRLDRGYRLAVSDFRARFSQYERVLSVEGIYSGYRARQLFGEQPEAPQLHRRFVAAFPSYFMP